MVKLGWPQFSPADFTKNAVPYPPVRTDDTVTASASPVAIHLNLTLFLIFSFLSEINFKFTVLYEIIRDSR